MEEVGEALMQRGAKPADGTESSHGPPNPGLCWWREWELGLLVALVIAIYFSRLTDLSLRGEESRRGLVALEMIWSGDWIVPRQQADAGFMSSRPPLQNWVIAALGVLRGGVDSLAIRLPSVTALLLVSLLLYWYARQILSRFGAFATGAAYVTLLQVMELGRLGETDQLLTLFVSGSLLLWHGGLSHGWHPGWIWGIGYFCAVLATMTKGLQGTVYFIGPVAVYLLATRQWRFVFSRWHALGIGLFALVLGSWQIPFALEVGLEGLRHTFVGDVTTYTRDGRWWIFAEHLVSLPAEILLGCLMPWSIYLFAYFSKDFRARLGNARATVLFLTTALLVTFPTVWFVPLSLTRFYASMYPCLALLIGIAMQRCFEAGASAGYGKLWTLATAISAIAIACATLVVPAFTLFDPAGEQFGQPAWFLVVFAVACLPLAYMLWNSRQCAGHRGAVGGVASAALFLGMCSTGLYMNHRISTTPATSASMLQILERLPPGAPLVSLGTVPHLFNLHYGAPIRAVPVPTTTADVPGDLDYFCFTALWQNYPELPFAWEEVGTVVCDRFIQPTPELLVVVARRTDSPSSRPKDPLPQLASGDAHSTLGPSDGVRK